MADYFEEQKQKYTLQLREIIKSLPPFSDEFFRGIALTTSVKTRLGYAYDLRIFFNYILEYMEEFENKTMNDLTISDLDTIQSEDIDKFMEYLSYYTKQDPKNVTVELEFQNDEHGKARKLASIRS